MYCSSIPACLAKCEEITDYNHTDAEKLEAAKKETTNTSSTATNTTTANSNTSATNKNINAEDYKDREYYCNWVWYQEIIDKNTNELIYGCTGSHPWCFYADGTYENAGCCSDAEHTDCITLPNLL